MVKNLNAGDTGDVGLIPGSGRSPGGGNDNPPQYSCLENPTDRGAWRALVHGVAQSWTQLSTSKNSYWAGQDVPLGLSTRRDEKTQGTSGPAL